MKVSPWGNSQGIRITGPLLDHLNVTPGAELAINLTDKGIEIMKNTLSQDYAKEVARQGLKNVIAEAKESLTELRQVGIEKITYIAL